MVLMFKAPKAVNARASVRGNRRCQPPHSPRPVLSGRGVGFFAGLPAPSCESLGIPIRLYVDNGKVFHSQQLARIAASLGILIVHSPPYQPEGRGKIERWFRTVRQQFLANLDRNQTLTVETLNARLWSWIDNGYHVAEHSSLGTTPLLRWQRDIEQIRQIPPATDVRRLSLSE